MGILKKVVGHERSFFALNAKLIYSSTEGGFPIACTGATEPQGTL